MMDFQSFAEKETIYLQSGEAMGTDDTNTPVPIKHSYVVDDSICLSSSELLNFAKIIDLGTSDIKYASEKLYALGEQHIPSRITDTYTLRIPGRTLVPAKARKNFSVWQELPTSWCSDTKPTNADIRRLSKTLRDIGNGHLESSVFIKTGLNGLNRKSKVHLVYMLRIMYYSNGLVKSHLFVSLDFSRIGAILVHEEQHSHNKFPELFYETSINLYSEEHVYVPIM